GDRVGEIRARYLVDASGRGAPATSPYLRERRWLRVDRQIAVLGSLAVPDGPVEPLLVLEPVENGWWYSVPEPDGTLLTVLITDADLLPVRGGALAEHFAAGIRLTTHTRARAQRAELVAHPRIVRCDSGLLIPSHGVGWSAVGDAAMACDPLG